MNGGLFELDHYVIRRKVLKIFGASFHVYDARERVVAFSSQKAFKLKEDIRVYSDESRSRELLRIHARQIVDFAAAYDVIDGGTGSKIGAARRKGFRSIMRDAWEILDERDRVIGELQEDSAGMAFLRRFLSNLIPQTFHLLAAGKQVAEMRQRFNPFIYRLAVTLNRDREVDRRLVFAAAVLVAAIEGRQQ